MIRHKIPLLNSYMIWRGTQVHFTFGGSYLHQILGCHHVAQQPPTNLQFISCYRCIQVSRDLNFNLENIEYTHF